MLFHTNLELGIVHATYVTWSLKKKKSGKKILFHYIKSA